MASTIKCVILDDEILALSYLKLLCEQIDFLEVVKVYNDPQIFLKEILTIDCDLCFLDIEMPGTSGIEIAKIIGNSKKIIFTTAYKEYAAEAFDLEVVDYIRKPIQLERLQKAIEKFRQTYHVTQKNDFIEWNSNIGKTIIFINKIAYIKTSEIDSRDKEVILFDGRTILLKNLSLKILLEMLPQNIFAQINKKEIISKKAIQLVSSTEISVSLYDKSEPIKLMVGESYKTALHQLLEGNF